MTETDEILAYIKKCGGASWSELEREFTVKRMWSKGRFVHNWKLAKKFLGKIKEPKTKRYKYVLKNEAEIHAQKALLKNDIDESDLHQVEVNQNRLISIAKKLATKADQFLFVDSCQKVFEEFNKKRPDLKVLSQQLFSGLLISAFFVTKYRLLKLEHLYEEVASKIRINIFTPKGETPPELTEEDVLKIIEILCDKVVDSNKGTLREKSFFIIIGFPVSKFNMKLFAGEDSTKGIIDTCIRAVEKMEEERREESSQISGKWAYAFLGRTFQKLFRILRAKRLTVKLNHFKG